MRPFPLFVLSCVAAAAFAASYVHASLGLRLLLNEVEGAMASESVVGYVRATGRSCTHPASEVTKANPDCARLLKVSGDLAARPDDQYLWVERIVLGAPRGYLWVHNPLKIEYARIPRFFPALTVYGQRYEIGQDVLALYRPGERAFPHVAASHEHSALAWCNLRWALHYSLIAAMAMYATVRLRRMHPDVLDDPSPAVPDKAAG